MSNGVIFGRNRIRQLVMGTGSQTQGEWSYCRYGVGARFPSFSRGTESRAKKKQRGGEKIYMISFKQTAKDAPDASA